jgi:geranylgeranyl diphosphate synthase type II
LGPAVADRIAQWRPLVDAELRRLCGPAPPRGGAAHEATLYALGGGKRVRPVMVMAAAETFGRDPLTVLTTACGIELLHTGTLVHDDLPCMDDDDFRRGQPSTHRRFGEAVAVLAGDGLLIEAFRAVASQAQVPGERPEAVLRVLMELGEATGTRGLIAGQVLDLAAENITPDLQTVSAIHRAKTGLLFRTCARAGAILAAAPEPDIEAIGRYGELFGEIFQITDDILDVVGTQETIGKPVGSDQGRAKATYPALMGLDASREQALRLLDEAKAIAASLPRLQDFWSELAEYLTVRDR